ncbi:glutathione S-transferase family protein [Pseudooctadecabacter jejudonensis]|uniref:Glutathione S-transferase GST-6.0 n=1 Tax=Pseudooctadecabacter jejudonensis TaxID=1391910 RepID=A0A1Y5R7D5_9RHOB|nr:glutathione S-transferase family protein [Pseudooctadecabacter jejudonensis]SLN10855.1 Glutathione S-transferase GST-6.0 [Pseudooctadecabacter jejudonensis]
MLTLFAAKNTVAFASHIALEETGLAYQINWISFADGDQLKPDYLALNPKGRVPALVTDDGVLTETPATLEYIAETSGQLMPDTAFDRAKVREMLSYCTSTFHVNHAHKMRGARWSDDVAAQATMQAKVPQTMAASCAYIEDQLTGDWVAGAYSIADIHVHTICRWLEGDGVDIADYPKLHAHFGRMQARAAVRRVSDAHG